MLLAICCLISQSLKRNLFSSRTLFPIKGRISCGWISSQGFRKALFWCFIFSVFRSSASEETGRDRIFFPNHSPVVSLEKWSVSGSLLWSSLTTHVQSQAFFANSKWHFSTRYHHFNRCQLKSAPCWTASWWEHQLKVWMEITRWPSCLPFVPFFRCLGNCQINIADLDKLSTGSLAVEISHLSAGLVSCTEDLANMVLCQGVSNCLYLWQ